MAVNRWAIEVDQLRNAVSASNRGNAICHGEFQPKA
jgi:hypothetical protein